MTNAALRGKPDAGIPHVRFDEGEVASAATSRRGFLLYKRKTLRRAAFAAMALSLCGFPLMAESFLATYEAEDWMSDNGAAPTQDASVGQQTDALQALMRTAGELARNGRVKGHFGAGRYVIDDYLPIYSNMSFGLDAHRRDVQRLGNDGKGRGGGSRRLSRRRERAQLATATGATVHLYAVWK